MTDIDRDVANLVRGAAPVRFDEGFRDRVLERISTRHESPLTRSLQRQFVRIVPLAAAAALILAAYNWWGARNTSGSPLDAALNLPRVTLSSAYAPASLYGTTIASSENQ